MKRQKSEWSCGAAVVRNVLRVFGKKVSEHVIRGFSDTTKEFGTSEFGIMKALSQFGFRTEEHHFDNKNEAWNWIHETLQEGYPVILAVQNWEHWIVAMGSLGDRGVVVFDSSNYKNNVFENGTYVWNKRRLMHQWYNDRVSIDDNEESRLYAISVWKKK